MDKDRLKEIKERAKKEGNKGLVDSIDKKLSSKNVKK